MPDRQRGEIIRSRGPVALPVQGAPVLLSSSARGGTGTTAIIALTGLRPRQHKVSKCSTAPSGPSGVLHEIIPGGSSRIWFCESDATMGGTNGENPQGTTKRAGSGTYFELHFAMLRVLAAKDPRLCVHFLYGGESPGFFELSAQNRGLVAAMAIKAA
jgi:hypothetical protein